MHAGQTKQQFSKSSRFKRFNLNCMNVQSGWVSEYKRAWKDKENLVQYFVFETSQKRLHFGHFSK